MENRLFLAWASGALAPEVPCGEDAEAPVRNGADRRPASGRRSFRRSGVRRSLRMKSIVSTRAQPAPLNPGVSKQKVRQHARRLFRDQWERRPLTSREWRLAEEDLVRRLEAEAL